MRSLVKAGNICMRSKEALPCQHPLGQALRRRRLNVERRLSTRMHLLVVEGDEHMSVGLGTIAAREWSRGGSLEQEFASTGELAPPSGRCSRCHRRLTPPCWVLPSAGSRLSGYQKAIASTTTFGCDAEDRLKTDIHFDLTLDTLFVPFVHHSSPASAHQANPRQEHHPIRPSALSARKPKLQRRRQSSRGAQSQSTHDHIGRTPTCGAHESNTVGRALQV